MAWRSGWVQMAHLREWRSMDGGGSGGVFIGGPLAGAWFGVRSFCGLCGGGASSLRVPFREGVPSL